MHTRAPFHRPIRPRRSPAFVALSASIGVALLVAACGGGSSGSTTTTATAAATTPAASAVATAGGGNGSSAALGTAATFCGDWGKMVAEAAAVTGGVTSGSSTSLKDDLAQATTFIQALSDHAPAEIKADFTVYSQFWTDFTSAMEKANYDVTKIVSDPSLMQAFQALNDPKIEQATQNIDAWIQKNCSVQ